ncbi:hypothetical protein Salat_0882800 [Sesamum alatum]|uniref:Uncharacterized protein n=1 Tax=Sesamum alatum TaxID=300844 RepID=A0AAE2CQY2_9LAMI|nr:hypothetical protein Salat_0882800 [Sesamum alatum]
MEKLVKSSAAIAVTPVKMHIPFELRCNECGRRTHKGDIYLGLKEEVEKDSCLDVEIYRFDFKCPSCRATFSIKSDPGRYDYVVESEIGESVAAIATLMKMHIPFELWCNDCGKQAYKGDKFLRSKEEVGKDSYLGVDIYIFEFQCPSCHIAFFIKSDPGWYDYIVESGATLIPRKF